MNLILLVLLVGVILLVLGNPAKTKKIFVSPPKEKEKGYSTLTDYNLDAASVYGAFQK